MFSSECKTAACELFVLENVVFAVINSMEFPFVIFVNLFYIRKFFKLN